MATVLINDTVKKFLLGQPKPFRERIRRKFEFLESGLWEGNLRTRKLRGLSSKCVFEVAADADLRVLFTLGRPGDRQSNDLIVYVWGIASHDRLDRRFRQVIPENVPFLKFHDYDEALFKDVCLDDLDSSCFTQESITEKVNDESGSQRWYPVEEPEWKRIRSYSAEELELFLCLTPEQKDILESPPPVLVSGTAGSGKTTLAVYYLLRRDLRTRKNVFISFNRHLKLFAECHLRLKHGDEAARYFKLAADFESAGTIYHKLKDFGSAMECFLKSEADEKSGYFMAKQAARKVRDVRWVCSQARSLFETGFYKKALALFSILGYADPETGICLKRMNDEAGWRKAWSRITRLEDYSRLIDMCLSQDEVRLGGQFFLEKYRTALSRGNLGLPYDLIGSKLVDFMDAYFAEARQPEEARTWGRFLGRFDFEGIFWKNSFSYLELGGDTGALVDFVERLDFFNRRAYLEIKKQWKKEMRGLEEREDWDGLALRDYFLNEGRRIPEFLGKMTVGARNYIFFLSGKDQFFNAAVDWCSLNDRLPEAWEQCAKWKRHARAALICERAGCPEKAAEFYVSAWQPEKAASIYVGLGKFNKAGDAFYKRGVFAEALALYERQKPPDKRRLARTHEKMGDFAAALDLWNEAGDKRAAGKCRDRWDRSRQRRLFDH